MFRTISKFFTFLALSVAIAGCFGKNKQPEVQVEQPASELYQIAKDLEASGDYKATVKAYEEVERQHPKDPLAKQAIADIVDLAYSNMRYKDVVIYADNFLAFNPKHKLAPKVAYIKAQSYYEQIVDVGRDQGNTENALTALTDVILRYPDSVFALSARNKIDLTKDHIAGKHLDVGRFYLRQNAYQPALARFNIVVQDYSYSSQVPEALARMVEGYLALGLYDRAYAAGAILGHNHKNSRWYQYAYDLIQVYKPE